MQALEADAPAVRYEKTANALMGQDDARQEHYVAARRIRLAVELADLHALRERRERLAFGTQPAATGPQA